MEFSKINHEFSEANSLYECIKPLPIEGGFNISDQQSQISVMIELCKTDDRIIRIDDIDRWVDNRNASIGWDSSRMMSHHSKINGETLKFSDYFKLKHEHRGKNLKKFGV